MIDPFTSDESGRLSDACETTERIVVWTWPDTELGVSELCALTSKSVLRQQRLLRFKGKGGPSGKKTKVRVVPMSIRVRARLSPDDRDRPPTPRASRIRKALQATMSSNRL